MKIQFIHSINDISAEDWNSIAGVNHPFTRHEFLSALENNGCVGEKWGWLPRHLTAYQDNRLIAAIVLYIKENSYGELVFDWSWADAYQRAGLRYYPKLVSAIPYTPATGQRIFLHPHENPDRVMPVLIEAVMEYAARQQLSSIHWLFTDTLQTKQLQQLKGMTRLGCQFQWHNNKYRDFEDYLSCFSSKKRKKIKRERRFVKEASVEIEVLEGSQVSAAQWDSFYRFYHNTFEKRGGWATLSKAFFQEIGVTMGHQILLIMCRHNNRDIASSLCFKSDEILYGRHWGCDEEFHSLHFEACYYQGLEYCIHHGLQKFEPGAQGEHKVSRGFLPQSTYSVHWLQHPKFSEAIKHYLEHETGAMQDYITEMGQHSPFKAIAAIRR